MKVTNNSTKGIQGSTGTSVGRTKDKLSAKTGDLLGAGKTPESPARLNLSDKAQDIKKSFDIAKTASPGVDEAKVAKFQALIDSGKYKVDAKAVADKMVDEHIATSAFDDE